MSQQQLYVAGIGMITSIGVNANTTAAALNAGISGYKLSNYIAKSGKSIIMANVPDEVFYSMDVEIQRNSSYRKQYDYMIKMALLALQDTLTDLIEPESIQKPLPLLLAMPETNPKIDQIPPKLLESNLTRLCGTIIDPQKIHRMHYGRAAGLQLLELANRYLYELNEDYVIVGGSDSHRNILRINHLEEQQRLLFEGQSDGFAAGEAAGFLLLTRHAQYALTENGHIIALHPVGISDEPGYWGSEEPYRGEGLDRAFKAALSDYQGNKIDTLYSSMNGESFWSKEQGVAISRNKSFFSDHFTVEHPADCFGDIGAAMGCTLLGLSALSLLNSQHQAHLVYSSSDKEKRAAVMVEKINRAHALTKSEAH